jgi:hypothetical protein
LKNFTIYGIIKVNGIYVIRCNAGVHCAKFKHIYAKERMKYVVLQVVLKEKLIGTGSGNLTELEKVINTRADKGYRLHTITTASAGSKGLMGGDRI